MFFGWFRKTKQISGELRFDPQERGTHIIFGYLQIGDKFKVGKSFEVPKWMEYHPHTQGWRRDKTTNTIYVALDNLSWNSSLPGSGVFKFNDNLALTKKGLSRSKWNLPDFFKDAEISYHIKDSWKDGYFQSAAIGQEFVIKDNKRIEEWARSLIEGSQIESTRQLIC